jgi:mono/diheme cytochrome c family protein
MRLSLRIFTTAALVLFLASCTKNHDNAGNPARGKELFDSTCDVCHYSNSRVARAGPGLKEFYKNKALPNGAAITDENVELFIRKGTSFMPGYKDALSPEQMRDLIAYLKTL